MTGRKKQMVIYTDKASKSVIAIAIFIAENGYPENAQKFKEKLLSFGDSLTIFPDKYPICKQPQLAKRDMHCAVFQKHYMFVYKMKKNRLVVYNVLHSKTNPLFHSI